MGVKTSRYTMYTDIIYTMLVTKLLQFVMFMSKKYAIDESHSIGHSMDVLIKAHNIYEAEVERFDDLRAKRRVIYVSAILHDMCDKKYMDESRGIREIENFLEEKMEPEEIDMTKTIISTMSYSKVKRDGFPCLGEYQMAYHIVREADLLSAIDFDRCMIFTMYKNDRTVYEAFDDAFDLFQNRVFRHREDGLYLCDYSKTQDPILRVEAEKRIQDWRKVLCIREPTVPL